MVFKVPTNDPGEMFVPFLGREHALDFGDVLGQCSRELGVVRGRFRAIEELLADDIVESWPDAVVNLDRLDGLALLTLDFMPPQIGHSQFPL